jgi:hypothetical protein
MKDTETAARITWAVAAADPTMRTGTFRIALTGAAQNVALPTAGADKGKRSTVGGRFVRVLATGANVQISQGIGAAPVVVLNQISVMGTGHAGAAPTCVNGLPESFRLESEATHLGWISDAAAGFLELFISDKPVV